MKTIFPRLFLLGFLIAREHYVCSGEARAAGQPQDIQAQLSQLQTSVNTGPKESGLYFSSTSLNPSESNATGEKGHLRAKQKQRCP